MKILIIQLARFGDIYCTWPAIKALQKKYPSAQIDLLVRERFVQATEGLDGVNVKQLSSKSILQPLMAGMGQKRSLDQVSRLVDDLKDEKYDVIYNFSFSPFSSYLTHAIGETAQIFGYTRHQDGTLAIPDEASAYFYSQVGVDRKNRIHLVDLFSSIAGVDPIETFKIEAASESDDKAIVLQIGASTEFKTLSLDNWIALVQSLRQHTNKQIIVLGSEEDAVNAKILCDIVDNVVSLCGKTRLIESMAILQNAELLVAPDSVTLHMANLVGTRAFNISMPTVNFWETGPRVEGSCVTLLKADGQPNMKDLAAEIISCIEKNTEGKKLIQRTAGTYTVPLELRAGEYEWQLISALYLGAEFPEPPSQLVAIALEKIEAVCELALEQINNIVSKKDSKISLQILSQVDVIISTIPQIAPEISVFVSWFETERARIGPASFEVVTGQTKSIFEKWQLLARALQIPNTDQVNPKQKGQHSDMAEI